MVFDVFFGSKWIRQLLVALVGKLLFFASEIRYAHEAGERKTPRLFAQHGCVA